MTNRPASEWDGFPSCPIPLNKYPTVTLAHGGGGRLTQDLIRTFFLDRFRNPALETLHDGAIVGPVGGKLAFSTDSYVIQPLFFPGGDIGSLAVNGTVNDLAMCGAKPAVLSAGFIIEEGMPMEELWRVVLSMERAARAAGIDIVTGDTKVVDKGKGDKLYINTAGIGIVRGGLSIDPKRAAPGDVVILSGRIAEHGIAVMSVREGLSFDSPVESDCAPLIGLVDAIAFVGKALHVLRDPTRGGVASALNEIASSAGTTITIEEALIPVSDPVRGACEILGFDPLYVANEGKLIAIVSPEVAETTLAALRAHPLGREAVVIGSVSKWNGTPLLMRSRIGGLRVVDMLSGEQLPRIC